MSDIDESQVTPTPAEPTTPVEEKPELSLAEELAKTNDKTSDDEPENPPAAEEPKPTEEPEKPADPVEEPVKQESDEEKETRRRNYEMAQKRIQERDRKQLEQRIDEAYQPQPVDELTQHFIDQGYDQFQAEMLARDEVRNQRDQINTERTKIAELNMQIETEALQVMHEFPVFDPNSPDYDKDFAEKASSTYARVAGIKNDQKTGAIIAANLTPYNFYKDLAEMRNSGMSTAQVKAQQAAQAQMAAAAPPSSTPPPKSTSKEDDEVARLNRAFDRV